MTNKDLLQKMIEVMPSKIEVDCGYNNGLQECINSLPKILEVVKEYYREEIEKINVDGGGNGRRLKEQIKDLLK